MCKSGGVAWMPFFSFKNWGSGCRPLFVCRSDGKHRLVSTLESPGRSNLTLPNFANDIISTIRRDNYSCPVYIGQNGGGCALEHHGAGLGRAGLPGQVLGEKRRPSSRWDIWMCMLFPAGAGPAWLSIHNSTHIWPQNVSHLITATSRRM